jgi:signal recognition particle receptor subunit beta
MGMFAWLSKFLGWLGPVRDRPSTRTIMVTGLDNAGKRTLLEAILSDPEFRSVSRTVSPSRDTIRVGSFEMRTYDLNGHPIMRDWFADVSGVVFVIDSSHRGRFQDSARELSSLFEDPALRAVPFLILANKTDVAGSATFSEIEKLFNLGNLCYGAACNFDRSRPVHLVMASVRTHFAFVQGLKWLATAVYLT